MADEASGPDLALLSALEDERRRRQAIAILDQERARRAPSMAAGVTRAAFQGVTFGFGDEIEAAARAGVSVAKRTFGLDSEADAAVRALWDRGEDGGFASAAGPRR